MPTEPPSALVLGDRPRRLPEPAANGVVVASRFRAPKLVQAGHVVCVAAPDALPFRAGSLDRAWLERSLRSDQLPGVIADCALALRPGGHLELESRVRTGTAGAWRWLAAKLLNTPPPERPETIALRLLQAGFDRIEQALSGNLCRFRARRLPGRA